MYKIVIVDDDKPRSLDVSKLERIVAAALAEQGETASVSSQNLVVDRNEPSWEQALDAIIQQNPSIVFIDDHMPGPNDGINFIRSLRARGYKGYTYIHTGIHTERALNEFIDLAPKLLQAHGSGVIPKGKSKKEKKIISELSDHLRQGEKKGLAYFQVEGPGEFLELSPYDRALELLDDLYNFQLFWSSTEPTSNNKNAVFEKFVLMLPEAERSKDIESWLAIKSNLKQKVREQFTMALNADEWQKVLEKLRDGLLPKID